MRIGVVTALGRSSGGTYQYTVTMIRELQALAAPHEFLLFHPDGTNVPSELVDDQRWRIVAMRPQRSTLGKIKHAASVALGDDVRERLQRARARTREAPGRSTPGPLVLFGSNPLWADWFARFDLDLVIYPVADPLSFEAGVPYVVAVHDLQHRLQPEFPEVSAHGEWELREFVNRNCIGHAVLVLADSEAGREDILRFYANTGATRDRVRVLPFLPASYLEAHVDAADVDRVRLDYDLPEHYFFYPAQFWPHKNHARIVEALAEIAHEGLDPHLVLSGAHSGNLREQTFARVMETAGKLGVSERITYLGYVPDRDMAGLYAGALALVMPTFFGPTNIPVLEAFSLGCPVITTDIHGIREQVGDSALLVDPRSSDSIAEAMRDILTDPELRARLAARGRALLGSYTAEDYRRRLAAILEDARRLTEAESADD